MRTLATQMRLRRLLRTHAEVLQRAVAGPADPELTAPARNRLLELVQDVRESWLKESAAAAAGAELVTLRRHVSRALSAMQAAVAVIGRPGWDPGRAGGDFREAALPLVFFLRGLEELPERQVLAWFGAPALQQTA
jgi:hypothetical protein